MTSKTAIITGATSGIGRAAAQAFAREGASIVITGRDKRAVADTEAALRSGGAHVAACVADLTTGQAPAAIVETAVSAFGGFDVLVNAAGALATGTVQTTTDEAWDAMMDLNVRAPFRLMREAAPHLAERKGSIVNVSSVNGLRSFGGVLAYCVSKAALDHLTRCAALEMAPLGVRVNAVNPGVTVTNLHRRSGMDEDRYAAFLEHSKGTHPLGRAGQPEEVAALILFLASDRAGWMTGETIPIDGGRHLTCAR